MKHRGATFLACVFSLVAAHAWAQARAGGETRINTFTTGQQNLAGVAQAADGTFVVAWIDGYGFEVAGRRFAPNGTAVGAELVVNSGPFPTSPVPAWLPGGGFVVAWTHYSDGSQNGIRAQRFDASGGKAGAEFQVNVTTSGSQFGASVSAAGTGFVVVWTSPQDGDSNGVVGQRFAADGARLGGEFIVNEATTGNQSTAHVAGSADGFVVTWMGYDAEGTGVFGQRFDAAGQALGGNVQVNIATTGDQRSPGVARAADSSFVVVYASNAGAQDVLARRFDASGAPQGGEFQVNSTTAGRQDVPSVAVDATGGFVVSWVDVDAPGGADVRARRFHADGTARGLDFLVNTYTTGIQSGQVFGNMLGSDAVGNLVVVWQSPSATDPNDVFLQRFGGLLPSFLQVDPTGNEVWEPGEAAQVKPTWQNISGGPKAPGGTLVSLTGPGGTYTITQGATVYAPLPGDGTTSCLPCYTVSVATTPGRPVTHLDATAVERLTPDADGETKAWTLHVGGSFADAPASNPFYRFIETLLHNGVTSGCGSGNYCPGLATTRDQMAVFVLAAKDGAGLAPPACGTPLFGDVPASSPFCRFIEELARRGVVSGCGGGNYCPANPVTREQMSIFVLKTLDPALDPPACTTPVFADVPASSPFCRWIEELARRGVVSGCGGGNYCPQQPVTREQMGVFISVTFGLRLYGP